MDLTALLERAVGAGDVVGVVAGIVDRHGARRIEAAGSLISGGDAMALDTVFAIMSMTKPITCVAALQLVERGVIDLDQPASDFATHLADAAVLDGFAPDGQPRLRAPSQPITIRHLLAHTSGFAYEFDSAELVRYHEVTALPKARSLRLDGLSAPLVADPGSRWTYGISTDQLGRVVEAASGLRLDAYFARHVFEPLGMTDTAFAPVRPRAPLHRRDHDGSLVRLEMPAATDEPEYFSGGGGLHSTAADYLTFLHALISGGGPLLSASTVEGLGRPLVASDAVGRWTSASASLTNDLDMLPGIAKGWGPLGLVNLADVPGARLAGSLAWAGLFNSYFWADPRAGLAGVSMTQVLPFFDARVVELFAAIERHAYASPKT